MDHRQQINRVFESGKAQGCYCTIKSKQTVSFVGHLFSTLCGRLREKMRNGEQDQVRSGQVRGHETMGTDGGITLVFVCNNLKNIYLRAFLPLFLTGQRRM